MTALVLCGCSATGFTSFSIEELLRAPQPSPEQNAVQKALNAHFGETLQLKYPRYGNEMTPFIMRDFDNDGQTEAAVLYTSSAKGQNVHLAILENNDNAWEVVQEIEGLAAEVLLVDSITLYEGKADSIVVGYTAQSMNNKFLAIYTYSDETLSPVFNQEYSSYTITDIDHDSLDEIIYVQMAKPSLYVVEAIESELKVTSNLLLDERFTACVNISAARNGTVAVDGMLQTLGLATSYYTTTDGKLTKLDHSEADIFNVSTRYVPSLLSCDIDENNSVDVPCIIKAIDTFNTTRRFYFITWNDFSLSVYEKRFGIYDSKYNYFVRLPSEWKGECNLTDDGTEDGGWQLRSPDGYKLLLSAKLAPRSFEAAASAFKQVAVLGEKRLLLSFASSCTPYQIDTITNGISVF